MKEIEVDNVVSFPEQEGPPDMFGPERSGSALIIDGRMIPNFAIYDKGETIDFVLDNRYGYEFPKEWAHLAASMAANAMAIGAGYPYLGAESKDQPFAPRCMQVSLGQSDD